MQHTGFQIIPCYCGGVFCLLVLCYGCFTAFLRVEIWHWKACQKNLQTLSSIHIGGEAVKRSYAGPQLSCCVYSKAMKPECTDVGLLGAILQNHVWFPLKGEDIPIWNRKRVSGAPLPVWAACNGAWALNPLAQSCGRGNRWCQVKVLARGQIGTVKHQLKFLSWSYFNPHSFPPLFVNHQ